MPWEMRHTVGGGCRRQVWRRKMSHKAEDASGGGRHIGRWKMHWKVEDASEGGRCVGRRRRCRKQKQSSRWKGVAEGGSPYNYPPSRKASPRCERVRTHWNVPSMPVEAGGSLLFRAIPRFPVPIVKGS